VAAPPIARSEIRPINYGLQTFSQAWFEDAPRLFPLANTYIGGGCVSFEGEDTRTRVLLAGLRALDGRTPEPAVG